MLKLNAGDVTARFTRLFEMRKVRNFPEGQCHAAQREVQGLADLIAADLKNVKCPRTR